MNRILWRAHPVLNTYTVKIISLLFSGAVLWQAVAASLLKDGAPIDPWLLLTSCWWLAAAFTVFGPFNQRVGEFALGLPVAARRHWTIHGLQVLVHGGGVLALCLIPSLLLAFAHGVEASAADAEPATRLHLARQLATHGPAWWLLLVAVTLGDRPHLAGIARDRRWATRQLITLVATGSGLMLIGARTGPAVALLVALVAMGILVSILRGLPEALLADDARLRSPTRPDQGDRRLAPLPWWRRRPLWLVVLLAATKHPAFYLLSAPVLLLMGAWNTSSAPVVVDDQHPGWLFLAITAYGIFSLSAASFMRLSRIGSWPISRDRLLACLMLPPLTLVCLGYLAGELAAGRHGPITREPMVFDTTADDDSLHLPPFFLSLAWDRAPTITAPDGTAINPPVHGRPVSWSRLIVYNPYHVAPDASPAVAVWQLERASAAVFDRPIEAAVFQEHYLTVDNAGRVAARGDVRLPLLADHPDLRVRRFAGVLPVQALVIGLLVQGALAVYLLSFRPGRSDRLRKGVFVGMLAALMLPYLGQFFLDAFGVIDLRGLAAVLFAGSDLLIGALPGGLWTLWTGVLLVLATGSLVVRHLFRRAEFPAVRDGDTFVDMMG